MMRINEILRGKGHEIITVPPEATVRELLDLLAAHNIGAAVVSTDGETVAGIVSERDIVRRLRSGSQVLDVVVASIMTEHVYTAGPNDLVEGLMRTMTNERIRHIPVVSEDRLVGLVSIGDIVKSRIQELEFEREQLENYIVGGKA